MQATSVFCSKQRNAISCSNSISFYLVIALSFFPSHALLLLTSSSSCLAPHLSVLPHSNSSHAITLALESVSLEQSYDYLDIYKGHNINASNLILSVSGTYRNITIQLPPKVLVRLRTDHFGITGQRAFVGQVCLKCILHYS